jgi:hypothetical protein
MTTDTRTTNRNYPKPYPSNLLAADVVRLREALDAIDTDIAARPDAATINGLIDTAVSQILDGAPAALDTLNELAASLGDDANMAATIANDLAAKLDKTGGALTGQITLPNNPTAGTLQAATALYVEQTVSDAQQSWVVSTANVAAANGDGLLLDVSGGAFTVTLPAAPSVGDYVAFAHAAGDLSTNKVTVDRNSENILGQASNLEIDSDNLANFQLVYAGATAGWRIS